MNRVLHQGDIVYPTEGKFRGVKMVVKKWHHDHVYSCELIGDPRLVGLQVVHKANELETQFERDRRLGLLDKEK